MGDSRVSRAATAAAVLLAITAVLLASSTPDTTTTTVLAAERIDLGPPGVPIRVAGSFGTGGTDLADSAAGDRAVAAVLADLQDFWSLQLSADGGPGLTLPAGGYVSIDSTGTGPPALCVTDPTQVTGNTFYCPQGDGIVFDSSALVPVLLGHYGSAGLAAAFAHEFGHAIQARVGPTLSDRQQHPERYPSIVIEAQADCDAGAFLAWASAGESARVHLPPASLLRAVAPLLDFRDASTVSPKDATAHGLGLDRLSFLLLGFRQGHRLPGDVRGQPPAHPRPTGGNDRSTIGRAAVPLDRCHGRRRRLVGDHLRGRAWATR